MSEPVSSQNQYTITPVGWPGGVLQISVIDFSSAYSDEHAHMFDPLGPSIDEETAEYSPPEVLMQSPPPPPPLVYRRQYTPTIAYDSWSAGILMLELLMASNQVRTYECVSVICVSHGVG